MFSPLHILNTCALVIIFKENKILYKVTVTSCCGAVTGKLAFSKTSAVDGGGTLFKENVYFIRIYKLIHVIIKLILHVEQLM